MHPDPCRRFPSRVDCEWLTVDEVARRLGYERATVYALVLADWLPHVYVGGAYRIPDTALDEVVIDV